MKKTAAILLKSVLGLILLVLILLFTLPVIFRDKIKEKVVQVINGSVNARVSFTDYKLGFFRHFPSLTFSLDNVSVTGVGKFENDTLAGFRSASLTFNLASLFAKSGYEVKSVLINDAAVNALVLKDGSANWDIMKDTSETTSETGTSAPMKILLKKVKVTNSSVSYTDMQSDMDALLDKVNFTLKGDMTASETNLQMLIDAGEVTFDMERVKYLNRAKAEAGINLRANLDSMKFNLLDNYLTINDMKVKFDGMVAMPGDDIVTDLTFKTDETSFKSLLSLIPAVYMKDFKDLKASGEFTLSGSARGVYSDADSTMPNITLALNVDNGLISYPSLPDQIKDINLRSSVFVDGKNMDGSTVNVENFHMELAGNPFDLKFALKTPVSDPDFDGTMKGKLDLAALSRAVPLDSISLSGLINASVSMSGKMSMIEKEQYDRFRAAGNLDVSNLVVLMTGYPAISIARAGLEFTPAYASLTNASLKIGDKSDFSLNGRLENYIPYIFKNELLKGNLELHSQLVDLGDIMSKIAVDTAAIEDTTSLAVVKVPENVNFDFNALIDQFIYNTIKFTNVHGHIIVNNGVLSMKQTGMNLLGGSMTMNAGYDTRDSLKPSVKADLDVSNLGIKDAFNTFNTIRQLAPTANGLDGKVAVKFSYSSLLGRNLMPVISTINGAGNLQSSEITLVNSKVYNEMKNLLKLGDNFTNTFKDLNVSFKINDGRVYVSPFDARIGNVKMNISGDQGLDQTINYIVKTEIPRSDLGSSVNSLIDNLSAQASAFGIKIKPAEIMKINLKITGTFRSPKISPFFGSNAPETTGTAGQTVKETVKATVGEAKEKALDEASVQADRVIREAEARAQVIREEAAGAAEKLRT
ncbi:MAG: AsmA-like C-terminal region-containing protein [Bacteroidales bacterium]